MVENSLASNSPHLDFKGKNQIINKLLLSLIHCEKQIKQIMILLLSFHINFLVTKEALPVPVSVFDSTMSESSDS